MKISPFQRARKEKLRKKAITLYREGFSTREVGQTLKRSHTWVWRHVKDLEENPE